MGVKRFFCWMALLMCWTVTAEILVWQDRMDKLDWMAGDKKTPISVSNNILTTTGNIVILGQTIIAVDKTGTIPAGSKLKFVIDARGEGEVEIGIWDYEPKVKPFYKKITLTSEFKEYSVEHTLPVRSKNIKCVLRGAGEFRNARLYNLWDPRYSIVAYPAYQMYDRIPEEVTFTLLKSGVPVPDAKLVIQGDTAYDPESGATCQVYAQRADTSAFDAVAGKIKLPNPLRILYFGDSLTHFRIGFNHADKVAFFLNKFNPHKVELFNYAVRGDTSSMTVTRIREKATDRFNMRFEDYKNHQYDLAFIFLGVNDTRAHVNKNYTEPFVSSERQKANYREIVASLRQQGAKRIVIISCPSLDEERLKQSAAKQAESKPKSHALYGKPELIEKYNAVSQELARELDVEYLDIYTPMKALADKNDLFLDGAHLNDKGHDFVALETLKYLAEHQK